MLRKQITYTLQPDGDYDGLVKDIYNCADTVKAQFINDDAVLGISVKAIEKAVPDSQGTNLELVQITFDIIANAATAGAAIMSAFMAWQRANQNSRIKIIQKDDEASAI